MGSNTVSSAACNLGCGILAALRTVGAVARTPRHRLGVDKFPNFLVGWTCQGFCHDLYPFWFEQRDVTII